MTDIAQLEHDYAELTWLQSNGGLTETQAQLLTDVKYQLACYYMVCDIA